MVKNSTGMYDLFYHLVESRYVYILHSIEKLYFGEPPPIFKKCLSSRTDLQEF